MKSRVCFQQPLLILRIVTNSAYWVRAGVCAGAHVVTRSRDGTHTASWMHEPQVPSHDVSNKNHFTICLFRVTQRVPPGSLIKPHRISSRDGLITAGHGLCANVHAVCKQAPHRHHTPPLVFKNMHSLLRVVVEITPLYWNMLRIFFIALDRNLTAFKQKLNSLQKY